jgi:hypothetical protein
LESKKQYLLSVAGKILRAEKLKITRKNEPTPSLESAFRAKGVTFLLTCVQISQNHYFVQFRSAGSWGKGAKTAQKLDFQRFFSDRVVVPTTRYGVSLSHLRETSSERNT